jgi:hypothetical protein
VLESFSLNSARAHTPRGDDMTIDTLFPVGTLVKVRRRGRDHKASATLTDLDSLISDFRNGELTELTFVLPSGQKAEPQE